VKRSKRGKVFYSCSEYPKCEIVFWDKPVSGTCPQCGAPFLLEKTTKKGTTRYCANETCGYRSELMPIPTEPQTAPEQRVCSSFACLLCQSAKLHARASHEFAVSVRINRLKAWRQGRLGIRCRRKAQCLDCGRAVMGEQAIDALRQR